MLKLKRLKKRHEMQNLVKCLKQKKKNLRFVTFKHEK